MGIKKIIKILSCLMILCFTLVACSKDTHESTKQEIMYDTNVTEEAKSEEVSGTEEIEISLNTQVNRKIIKSGQLTIETKAFEKSINDIFTKLQSISGFVENSTIEGDSLYESHASRYANITIRIPNTAFESFLKGASNFGNVRSKTMSGEDVTERYVDTEARLESLEVQRERLLVLLEQSGSLEDLFAIEKELANVSYEIEKFKGTLNKYDSLINYATVSITVQEVKAYQNPVDSLTLADKMSNTFKGSLEVLKKIAEWLLLAIVSLMPFVLIIVLPVGIIVFSVIIARRRLKKIRNNKGK